MHRPSNDREAITLIIDGLRERGVMPVVVNDTEEEIPVSTTAEAVAAITAVDEATLVVKLPEGAERDTSFIYFVLGNEPEEVACDYGVSLSDYLDPIVNPWWE